MPKVSVIIPIYNMEKYLRKALDSVVNQTLRDIEIVCIDDCSTDSSLKILKEYSEKDNRIRIFEQKENKGQGVARNLGIDNAGGEYIMFLDPDDWYENNACELAYKKVSKNNDDITFFGLKSYDTQTAKFINSHNAYYSDLCNLQYNKSSSIEETDIPHFNFSGCKIYNRNFLKNNNCSFEKSRNSEDVPFAVTTTLKANRISFLAEKLYIYRVNLPQEIRQQTTKYRISNWMEAFNNREKAYTIVTKCSKSEKYIRRYTIYYINAIIRAYDYYTNANKTLKGDIFNKVKELFTQIEKTQDVQKIKRKIDYSIFKYFIVAKDSKQFELLRKIFSIRNSESKKIIYILGIKISLKNK